MRKVFFLVAYIVFVGVGWRAQDAASAERIAGVLSLTPEERERILRARHATQEEGDSPLGPQRLNGWVVRSAGNGAYWVNGARFDAPRGQRSGAGISAAGSPPLRPGQIWDPQSEKVLDLLPETALQVHRK
jgi:hypothetical protein